jgi:ribosomal protein S18 acetylase RimI-like enzyme
MAKLSSEKRNQLKDSDFGIPEKRMYPLHDKAHIESAVKLFGHAETKYKKSLARKILRRAKEYNMDTSGWKQVLSFAQEAVPPMSNGTSLGNIPPGLTAPYEYSEGDELMSRVNSLGNTDMFTFAKSIVNEIHAQVEKDRKPPTGNQNCQLCTWCAEARFRGMNVLPRPVYSPRDPALAVPGENIVMNPVKEKIATQRQVVETVRGAVNSRWYVHINWKDSTGGHEFLVVNINDYAYIMDAQAGLLKEIDETDSTNSYFRDINYANSYMVRLDTKKFNTELFNEMNDPSKVMPWKNSLDIPYMRDNGMISPEDDSDPRFRRVLVPSEEGLKYLKEDPELSQYWEDMHKATNGEFLVDRDTGEAIGHVFVHTYKQDKGFIFNLEVNPKYRRQGYGWILIDDAVRRFGGEDLTVDADNTPAINLYLQYGFTIYKKGQWHYDPPKDELWMKYDRSKLTQESTNVFESGHFSKYKDDVLGFNDEGMAVMKKCDCGGKISIAMKGEPVYICESCGKYYGTVPCNIQEGAVRNIRDMTLVPVKDFKYNKVYYGDPTNGGDVRVLNGKPLFVTPQARLASIFIGRREVFHELSRRGYHDTNLGYDEWNTEGSPDEYLTDVHVYVKYQPDLEPFVCEFDGYLHTIDCSNLKNNIYRYPWMSGIDYEVLIAKVPEVKIENVKQLHVRYHVRGIVGRVPTADETFQEGADETAEPNISDTFDEQLLVKSKPILQKYLVGGTDWKYYNEHRRTNPLPADIRDALFSLVHVLIHTTDDFAKYDKYRKFLCDILGLPNDRVIYGPGLMTIEDGDLQVRTLAPETETFSNSGPVKLYHTSNNPSLTELRPTYMSAKNKKLRAGFTVRRVEALYPTPRVYFGYNAPISRMGGSNINDQTYVYLASDNDISGKTIKADTELKSLDGDQNGAACFVETVDPIRVTDVTAQFRKSENNNNSGNGSVTISVDQRTGKVVQEGAFQDIKNGVNPYSDDLVFHVSPDKHIDGQVWKPRVPDYLDPYNPEDTGFEDNTTPRICFSTSIEGCLNGITVNLQRQSPDTFDKMYVYVPEKPWKEYKHKTNKQLVKDKLVYDANVTREVWIMEPVRMKLYGVIRVDQIADAKRKSVVPTSKGQKDTRNYFTYKWHWVVKPKVLKKATKFDYSPERVIDDLCIDIKKFKYGLIKDGRLMTGNVSDKDYDKYWVFHSGETVDQAGGGNCYDMVEYEAGYLDAFGVAYKKYFMNFTDTKNTKTINTHTICVVPHNGKFIYIEQAFKRVVDEWGYERKKVFDKLNDIFEYVAEVSAEYENQDLNYGVWDYTNAEIDYGTPIKNFMEWIMTKCKMIYDGEATTKKSVTKESCEMYDYDDDIIEESETDMFIELGDMMFYVSEYHNALFDDPDAHDEAINEYGILLDSYDDEFIEETAKPYDDYLRKHNYDPATNTIEDPTKPGRRVNAGRIGSKKERNRMNKFLRENGYDPKTETILTDINDKNNPGQKKRVKFGINSAIGNPGAPMSIPLAYGRVDNYMSPDDDGDRDKGIAMSKKLMQQKPGSSNYILKHEEGHLAYDDAFDKETNAQWNANPSHHSPKQYREDINAARQHIRSQAKKNPSLKENSHDILPTEYQADKYGEDHNPYGRGYGGAALKRMMATVKTFDPDNFDSQREAFLEGFGKGEAGFKAFTENMRQQYEALINLMNSGVITKSTPGYSATKKSATAMKREIDAGFPESRKIFFSMTQPDQNQAIAEAKQRSRAMIDAGVDSRDAFMKKYETQAKVAQAKTAAKQRQLAKEQLKQQIASGQLTGDQAAKAERKIQRIEAFEAGKQQMQQQQPKQQTQPQQKQDTISVAKQSLSEPTVKKEGFKLSRFNSNRFYQEEEEYLSEDITVGDIDLDDEKDNPEDIQTDETSATRNTPEKVETSEEPEEIEPIENFEDIDIGDDEVPEYMKDRLSEEDKKEFESDDNNEMDVNNVELGSFGSDTSDVQNDYDQKEVDILMKLMASEADAMNEYMDGAKETNVDVLRRLYADIANEERFHMEQLLFAKSELTGEKYIPRDPDVKSEYEELLKMGMDENTAMQTAVDKCHIRGISVSVDNDVDEMKETQEEVETLEYAVEMFAENFDSFMKEFEMSDREKSFDKFVQEYLAMEAVTPEGKEVHKGLELGRNPITVLMKAADFVIKLLVELCRKIKVFLDRVKRSSANFKNYVQQIKMDPNGWKTFFEPIMLYFMPHYDSLNGKRVAIMPREMYQWYMLAYDTVVECGKGMNISINIQPDAIAQQYRTQNINGDIKQGAEMLNSIHLSREPMVKPADDDARNELIDMFMGYSDIIGEDGKSYNMLGSYQKFADIWRELLKQTEAMMKALVSAQNQVNENPQLRNTYELCMTGLNAVIKSSKAFAAAITKDINTIIKLDSDVYEAVRNKDNKRIEENEVAKNQNQAYKDRFGKVRNMNDANPPK